MTSTEEKVFRQRPTSLVPVKVPGYTETDPEGNNVARAFSTPVPTTPVRFYKKPTKPRDFAMSARKRQSVLALGSITHLQHFYAKRGIIIQPKKSKSQRGGDNKPALSVNVTDLMQITEEPEDFPPTPLPPAPPPLPLYLTQQFDVETDSEVLLATCHIEIHEMLRAWHIVTGDASEDENSVPVDILAVISATTKAIQAVKNYVMSKEEMPQEDIVKVRTAALDVLEMISTLEELYRDEDVDDSSSEDGHIYKATTYRSLDKERCVLRRYLKVVEDCVLFDDRELYPDPAYLSNAYKHDGGVAPLTPPASPGFINYDWVNADLFLDEPLARYHSFLEAFRPSKSKQQPDYIPLFDPRKSKARFLTALSDGRLLCIIYNTVVRRSKRPFGFIDKIHEDTTRTYRATENLKFFVAACKFRFDIKLDELNASEIVRMTDIGMSQLESTIRVFCEKAMDELISTGSYKSSPLSRVSSIYMLDSASSSQKSLVHSGEGGDVSHAPITEDDLARAFAKSTQLSSTLHDAD